LHHGVALLAAFRVGVGARYGCRCVAFVAVLGAEGVVEAVRAALARLLAVVLGVVELYELLHLLERSDELRNRGPVRWLECGNLSQQHGGGGEGLSEGRGRRGRC